MAINYTKVGWDTTKYINPTNMNKMDDGIKAAADGVDRLDGATAYKAGDTYRIAYQAIPALLWSSSKDILLTIQLAKSGVGLETTITGSFSVFGNGTAIIDNVTWGDAAYIFYRVDITVGSVTYRIRKANGTAFGAPTNTTCTARFEAGALLTFS